MNDPLGERSFDQLAGLLLAYLLGRPSILNHGILEARKTFICRAILKSS
jgi:hypothetical protein